MVGGHRASQIDGSNVAGHAGQEIAGSTVGIIYQFHRSDAQSSIVSCWSRDESAHQLRLRWLSPPQGDGGQRSRLNSSQSLRWRAVSPVEDLQSLRESCKSMVAALKDAALRSQLSRHEANSLIREAVAACLLLRWFDQAEAEQEAMAVFEDRTYRPLLPPELQWRHWSRLEQPAGLADRVQALAEHARAP